ncbi:diguanylate cyclase, partial [bacterium]
MGRSTVVTLEEGIQERTRVAEADLLNAEAFAVRHLDRHRARSLAADALGLSEEIGYALGRAAALRTLASVEYQENDYAGFEFAVEAAGLFETCGDEYGLATTHNILSCYYHSFGQYDTMLEHLRTAHAIADRLGDRRMQALCLHNMGTACDKTNDYEESVRLYENARFVWSELRDDTWYWISTSNMALALTLAGRPGEARPYAEEAVRNVASLDHFGVVDLRLNLATTYIELAEYGLAQAQIDAAEALCPGELHPLAQSGVFLLRGDLEARRGDRIASTFALREALARAIRHKTSETMGRILRLLAENARQAGEYEAACGYLEQFIAFRETVFTEGVEARSRSYQTIHRVEWTQREAALVRGQNDELHLLNKRLVATLAEKDALHAEMSRQAVTDELTGISNRRHVMEFGRREFERYRRLDAPLAVVMLDIDHFKGINDRLGHAAGDEVLRGVARSLGESVRTIDAYGRWGGEEFCVILPGASDETARRIAERIRRAIAEQ